MARRKSVARWFTDRRCPLATLAQPQRRSSGRVVPATNQNSGPCTPVAATLLTDWGLSPLAGNFQAFLPAGPLRERGGRQGVPSLFDLEGYVPLRAREPCP